VNSKGFSMVLFETEDETRASVPPTGDWTAPGVRIDAVDIRRVAVKAS
jgi:hypothetical protein